MVAQDHVQAPEVAVSLIHGLDDAIIVGDIHALACRWKEPSTASIADLADRHRVRKLPTAVEDFGQLRDAPRLVLAAELPPMGSARAQLFHRDR